MRIKLLIVLLLTTTFAGGASAAVIVEKRSRQLPFVEVFECPGVHAFIFRGPRGTSRKPILVPPKEYWVAREAGLYKFVLRYDSGNVRSRLVTPEVFARCRVGDHFYDRGPACAPSDAKDSQATVALIHRSRHQSLAQVRRTRRKVASNHHRTRSKALAHQSSTIAPRS
jgi:hypothetical protein